MIFGLFLVSALLAPSTASPAVFECSIEPAARIMCPISTLLDEDCLAVGCCWDKDVHQCYTPKAPICGCFAPDWKKVTNCDVHGDTGCLVNHKCGLGFQTVTLSCPDHTKPEFNLKCCLPCDGPGFHGIGTCACADVYPTCVH